MTDQKKKNNNKKEEGTPGRHAVSVSKTIGGFNVAVWQRVPDENYPDGATAAATMSVKNKTYNIKRISSANNKCITLCVCVSTYV